MNCLIVLLLLANQSFAEDENQNSENKIENKDNSDKKFRDFYSVLEDVIADFEYDLKNSQVQGLKNLSIRNIALSENVPQSFKNHIELLISEKIIKHTKTQIIECNPCRSKKATISGDNLIIQSPDQDPSQLARIARRIGVSNFMDIAFSYQPSGIILSLYTTDAESNAIVWSRTYNSETSRAEAFRRGVDYSQIDDSRKSGEYEPSTLYKPTIYYLFERTTNGYSGNLGLGFRMVERYDNRKKEVGFEVDYLLGGLGGGNTADPGNIYSSFNITLLFVHAWNLIGNLENFHKVRGSIFVAIGGTFASGYLGGLIRGGYEWRLGKHWAISGNLGFRPSASVFLNNTSIGTISGLEFGVGVSALLY